MSQLLALCASGCAIIGTGVTSMRGSGKDAVVLAEEAFNLALKDAKLDKKGAHAFWALVSERLDVQTSTGSWLLATRL